MRDVQLFDYRKKEKLQLDVEDFSSNNFQYVVVSYNQISSDWKDFCNFLVHHQAYFRGQTELYKEPTREQKRKATLKGVEATGTFVSVRKDAPDTVLHDVLWHRLICDDIHKTQRNSSWAECLYPLRRKHALVLTPASQLKRYQDCFTLIRLVRLQPFFNNERGFHQFFGDGKRDAGSEKDKLRRRIMACLMRACSLARQGSSVFGGEEASGEGGGGGKSGQDVEGGMLQITQQELDDIHSWSFETFREKVS